MGPTEQGGSSEPAVVTASTTATQRTDEGNMPHHTPTPVREVEKVGGNCRASGGGAVEETFLRHILPQVETVSIYIFYVSLHFALDAIIF